MSLVELRHALVEDARTAQHGVRCALGRRGRGTRRAHAADRAPSPPESSHGPSTPPPSDGSAEPIRDPWCSTGRRTSREHPLDDDGTLVDRARAGDVGAYELLVEQHQDIAVRVAALMCGAADAPDVTQEAFVKAWRALDRFRPGAPFRPWLLAIVANEARNARRSAGRRAALAIRSTEPPRLYRLDRGRSCSPREDRDRLARRRSTSSRRSTAK